MRTDLLLIAETSRADGLALSGLPISGSGHASPLGAGANPPPALPPPSFIPPERAPTPLPTLFARHHSLLLTLTLCVCRPSRTSCLHRRCGHRPSPTVTAAAGRPLPPRAARRGHPGRGRWPPPRWRFPAPQRRCALPRRIASSPTPSQRGKRLRDAAWVAHPGLCTTAGGRAPTPVATACGRAWMKRTQPLCGREASLLRSAGRGTCCAGGRRVGGRGLRYLCGTDRRAAVWD